MGSLEKNQSDNDGGRQATVDSVEEKLSDNEDGVRRATMDDVEKKMPDNEDAVWRAWYSRIEKEGFCKNTMLSIGPNLRKDLGVYYGYNDFLAGVLMEMFNPQELLKATSMFDVPRPTCVRVNTLKTRVKDLVYLLHLTRGVSIAPKTDTKPALGGGKHYVKWSNSWLAVNGYKMPLDATPEYVAGHYMVQNSSSFFPAMVLKPKKEEKIVELAGAAPGINTTHIAAIMNNTGSLYANEMNADRIPLLEANIRRLGVTNTSVGNYDGRKLPKVLGFDSQDRVLLDAPCSETGLISADHPVKSTISYEEIQKLGDMQKELLLAAIDLVDANSKSGGYIVYSTRSIMVEENEAVIDFALKNRNVKLVSCEIPYGCHGYTEFKEHRFRKSLKMTRRYYPHTHNLDGLFLAKLKKITCVKAAASKPRKMKQAVESIEEDVGKGIDEAINLGINKRKASDESGDLGTNKKRKSSGSLPGKQAVSKSNRDDAEEV